jgi:hypothetical protein
MFKKHLLAIPVGLLLAFASAPAFAQSYDDDQTVSAIQELLSRIVGNTNVTYSSNNPCQSGHMDDGTPVNCNNAIGVEVPRQVIIIRQHHQPRPFRVCWPNRGCHIEWR